MNTIKLLLVALIVSFGFTACEKDNDTMWINQNFTHEFPAISQNGNFRTTEVLFQSDIYRWTIYDMSLKNASIIASTNRAFSYGDEIIIDEITVDDVSFPLNYRVVVGSNLVGSTDISFSGDNDYMNFVHNALLRRLTQRGRATVSITGYSDMIKGNLFIVLDNNIDMLVDDER